MKKAMETFFCLFLISTLLGGGIYLIGVAAQDMFLEGSTRIPLSHKVKNNADD